MQLIENGSATRDQFRKASYAGAIGQTQFMPSTLLQHGRDFDKDGHEDLWTNSGDALASAANYLDQTRDGRRASPGRSRRRFRTSFDYSLGDGRKLTVAAWKATGLTPATAPEFASSRCAEGGAVPAGGLLWPGLPAVRQFPA